MNYITELSNYKKKDDIIIEMNTNRRILIVDDEPYNVLGLTIILKQSGYPNIHSIIDRANNGVDALNLVI